MLLFCFEKYNLWLFAMFVRFKTIYGRDLCMPFFFFFFHSYRPDFSKIRTHSVHISLNLNYETVSVHWMRKEKNRAIFWHTVCRRVSMNLLKPLLEKGMIRRNVRPFEIILGPIPRQSSPRFSRTNKRFNYEGSLTNN